MADVAFVIPGDLSAPTGGYAYDRQVLARLKDFGIAARHLALPGSFPTPSPEDLAETLRLIAERPPGTIMLIDGLAYGAFPPDLVARISHPVVALVHHPLGMETGLLPTEAVRLTENERAVLARADAVIVTSPATARLLTADFDVPQGKIVVAEPGTDPAARSPASGDDPVEILAVGSVIRRKGYDVLIDALEPLNDLSWRLTIVGSEDRSSEHALEIREKVAEHGLGGRIALVGAVDDATLAQHYANADLFVLASRFEGFGMVLTEALARGLPIVATKGGAAAETVSDAAAIKVPPDDVYALGEALRQAISSPETRRRLADAAWREAQSLPRWNDTARIVADVLKALV